jgi:ribonuclease P protein component
MIFIKNNGSCPRGFRKLSLSLTGLGDLATIPLSLQQNSNIYNIKGDNNGKNDFSAPQCPPEQEAWLSPQNGQPGRSEGDPQTQAQGPQEAVGLRFGLQRWVMDFRFTRKKRLRKNREFLRVFNQGRRFNDPAFSLVIWVRGRDVPARLGLSVSRKFGSSPQRNLFKRRLREIFRLLSGQIKKGAEMVVIPRPPARDLKTKELGERFRKACEKAGIVGPT